MKIRIKHYLMIGFALLVVMLASCTPEVDDAIEYIPFQETEGGKWGMISMDGKVLFKEEFKNQPTVVRNGRFFVKNESGFWEMYEATPKPKKIGSEYVYTTGFHKGRALVTERGKHASIINTDGETIKMLDKICGKDIEEVQFIRGGEYAFIETTDSLIGVVDMEGNCIIKPEYGYLEKPLNSNKFAGLRKDDWNNFLEDIEKEYKNKDKEEFEEEVEKKAWEMSRKKMKIIDMKGETVDAYTYFEKYEKIQILSSGGKEYIAVLVKKDGNENWGIIDDKDEYVVKPSEKIKRIKEIFDNKFTYSNGDGWGLMNMNGENLIRAKYDSLRFDTSIKNRLLAVTFDKDSKEYKYIDENDNQIGEDTYVMASLFSDFDGKHAVVKYDDKMYSIIDINCKQLKNLPDMKDVGLSDGDKFVRSDFVDMEEFLNELGIGESGAMQLTFKSSAKKVVAKEVELGQAVENSAHPAGTPYWYSDRSEIELYKNVKGVIVWLTIQFTGRISSPVYSLSGWYYNEDDYEWNNVKPEVFVLKVDNKGKMRGKLRLLLNALIDKFNSTGSIIKKNDGAATLRLNNGYSAFIYMERNNVYAVWGNIRRAEDIDISKYEDISEEGLMSDTDSEDTSESDYVNNEYMLDTIPPEEDYFQPDSSVTY